MPSQRASPLLAHAPRTSVASVPGWAVFLMGAVTGVGASYLLLQWRQQSPAAKSPTKKKTKDDENTTPSSSAQRAKTTEKASVASTIPWQIRHEQLSRHYLYFGKDGMDRLRHCKICVVGAGGVGSHTVCSLIRAGVGTIRVIDFDQVSLSSLNRHACATLDDVGTPKVDCLARYATQLCPDPAYLTLETKCAMYTAETGEALLGGHEWDMIIDAIDDVPTKADLIARSLSRQQLPENQENDRWRIISCMGAGGKSDFTRLHVSDLKSASRDPLATKLRQVLKRTIKSYNKTKETTDNNDYLENVDRLAIIFSSEKPVAKLADWTDDQAATPDKQEFGAVDGMRIRVLPVLGTTPGIMGQALAAMAITHVAQQPFQPVTGERIGRNVRNKLYQKLQTREDRFLQSMIQKAGVTDADEIQRFKTQGGWVALPTDKTSDSDGSDKPIWIGPLQIDTDDVEYLLEVWRNRCGATGARLGTVLEFVRWSIRLPSTCNNLVLLATHAKQAWDESTTAKDFRGEPGYHLEPKVRATIEARLSTCRVDAKS